MNSPSASSASSVKPSWTSSGSRLRPHGFATLEGSRHALMRLHESARAPLEHIDPQQQHETT